MLQELFGSPQTSEVTAVPEPSSREMPSLDPNVHQLISDHEDEANTGTVLQKPSTKQTRKSSKDAKNQSATKLKSNNYSPAAEQEVTVKNKRKPSLPGPSLYIIGNIDLTSAEVGTEPNLNISNELQSDDTATKSNPKTISITKNISTDIEKTPNQDGNKEMPSIIIEIEETQEDIEKETVAEQKTLNDKPAQTYKNKKKEKVPKNKDVTDSKDVSNIKTATKRKRNKSSKKVTKIDKGVLDTPDSENAKDTSKESQPIKEDPVLDEDKSEITPPEKVKAKRKRKSKMDANKSPNTSNSDQTDLPASKRKSQRIQNYTNLSTTDEVSSDFSEGDTASMNDAIKKLINKKPLLKRGMKLRVKSSFMKLGILEIATDGENLINKADPSNLRSGSKRK